MAAFDMGRGMLRVTTNQSAKRPILVHRPAAFSVCGALNSCGEPIFALRHAQWAGSCRLSVFHPLQLELRRTMIQSEFRDRRGPGGHDGELSENSALLRRLARRAKGAALRRGPRPRS